MSLLSNFPMGIASRLNSHSRKLKGYCNINPVQWLTFAMIILLQLNLPAIYRLQF